MKETKELTITFNADHHATYVLVKVNGEYHKKYLTELQHGNIIQGCVKSFFEKRSIALLHDAVKIEKDSEELLKKSEKLLEVAKSL